MKKVGLCVLLFLWIIGTIGSFGYALYYKADYPIIIGIVIAAAFGVPTVKKLWKYIND